MNIEGKTSELRTMSIRSMKIAISIETAFTRMSPATLRNQSCHCHLAKAVLQGPSCRGHLAKALWQGHLAKAIVPIASCQCHLASTILPRPSQGSLGKVAWARWCWQHSLPAPPSTAERSADTPRWPKRRASFLPRSREAVVRTLRRGGAQCGAEVPCGCVRAG